MKPGFRFTPDRVADLDTIWHFIAADGADAADRVEQTILAACETLSRYPLRGDTRRAITKLPVRFWTVPRYPNYIIVYRPDANPLQVVRILHAKRNLRILGP